MYGNEEKGQPVVSEEKKSIRLKEVFETLCQNIEPLQAGDQAEMIKGLIQFARNQKNSKIEVNQSELDKSKEELKTFEDVLNK